LFVYYTGKHFLDEAQLLSVAGSIVGRSLPPLPPMTAPEVEREETEKEQEQQTEGEEEKKEEEEEETEEKQNGDAQEEGGVETNPDEYQGKTSAAIVSLDKRVTEYTQIVKTRVDNKTAGEISMDARDAQVIAEAQNKVS
jgi:hypothetical protein